MVINITKKPKISLSKIVLEKSGDSTKINLSKSSDEIIINLNWSKNKSDNRFLLKLFNTVRDVDLDLGCYYQLNSGHAGVIDGVQFSHNRGGPRTQQTAQGCYTQAPWIWHCGDDRNGDSVTGENILINPRGIKELKRIIIYCFIYDGVARWAHSDAIVTIKVPSQPDIVVEMGEQNDSRGFCAIASIDFIDNQMMVRKEITFHKGHKECDDYYKWGFSWGRGSK
ncbi:hypothetical protein [Moraxella sp. Pampa]|uniref:hypothetical protein n=1 Tax=Moraxella sp. Pampa TaxID=3111978 RepID=UPI002B40A3F5|nr:hypothetical protein [Moraxella sp. Pampa]